MRTPTDAARRRGRLSGAIRLVVAAATVACLLQVVPVRELAAHFQGVTPSWVALAVLLQLAFHFLAACTLAILLRPQGLPVTIPRIFAVNLASAFYAHLTPGGLLAGGAVRWYRLGYRARRMPEVLAALVASRLLELTVLAGLAVVGWLAAPLPDAGAMLGAVPVVLFTAMALGYGALFSRPLALRLVVLLRRLVPGRGAMRALALRFLLATRAQARLGRRQHARLFALTLLRQLLAVAVVYALALGLGIGIGFATLLWVRSLTTMLIMLPVSLGGFGVREAVFVVLLQPYGVPAAEALLLALVASALALVPALLGGLLELRPTGKAGAPAARDAR